MVLLNFSCRGPGLGLEFYLDQFCIRELYFWKTNLKRLNCRVVADSPHKMSNYVVYSDARATRCGAHLDINDEQVCNKQWDLLEHRQSSTWRGICHFVHFTFFFILIRRLL